MITEETFEKAIRGKFLDVIAKKDYDAKDVEYLLDWHKKLKHV